MLSSDSTSLPVALLPELHAPLLLPPLLLPPLLLPPLLLLQTRMKLDEKKASDYLRRFLAGDPSIKLPRLSFALQVKAHVPP
jgi:hypothetical protein